MPKLNLNASVLSVFALDITLVYEKLSGPTGVCQSSATPAALLSVLVSLIAEL